MKWLILLALCGNLVSGDANQTDARTENEKKMADQIMKVLEHYKQPDPIGIPGVDIPDPLEIPPKSMKVNSFINMNCENMKILGLGKFRLKSVSSELSQMKANAVITLKMLKITGNYTCKQFFQTNKGPFTIIMTDLQVTGLVTLGVERDGKLKARDIEIDFSIGKIDTNFENMGLMGSMINSMSSVLIGYIKPTILQEAYEKIRVDIDANLDKMTGDLEFPNSISPLDMVIADTRIKVKQMKVDPYVVKDYNYTKELYKATVTQTWIMGLSSFYRVGNISMYVDNNTMFADFEVGTQKLRGETQWQLSFVGGFFSRSGTASFTVEYIRARVVISQSLDTRNRPVFKDFDLDLGNIQVRCNGAGTLDYAVELLINILPNVLRYQILDGIEGPIKNKVQEEFDKINVEAEIKNKLNTLDSSDMEGFKLSSLKNAELPPLEALENEDFWKKP